MKHKSSVQYVNHHVESEDSTPQYYEEKLRATLQDKEITSKDLNNAMEHYLMESEIKGGAR